jgi:hypothetical protein
VGYSVADSSTWCRGVCSLMTLGAQSIPTRTPYCLTLKRRRRCYPQRHAVRLSPALYRLLKPTAVLTLSLWHRRWIHWTTDAGRWMRVSPRSDPRGQLINRTVSTSVCPFLIWMISTARCLRRYLTDRQTFDKCRVQDPATAAAIELHMCKSDVRQSEMLWS